MTLTVDHADADLDRDAHNRLSRLESCDNSSHRKGLTRITSVEQSEGISPLMLGISKDVDELNLDKPQRHYSAKLGKRMSGRLTASPRIAPVSDQSNRRSFQSEALARGPQGLGDTFHQIASWINAQKQKRKYRRRRHKSHRPVSAPGNEEDSHASDPDSTARSPRRSSTTSDSSNALDELEGILNQGMAFYDAERDTHSRSSRLTHRASLSRKLTRQSVNTASDTEYNQDGDISVPSCDVFLDNSRTLYYLGGMPDSEHRYSDANDDDDQDQNAWLVFKHEIVRLTHTLRLKGWRRVPLDTSDDVTVERLSGALTNAVYVVSPPLNLLGPQNSVGDKSQSRSLKRPAKLLLRIYGPNVEHLIDRETELQILRRLARKRIGPRLLGTFKNGRFEQYFPARALKPRDLRMPDVSKQIAKRMRELHDGIELLPRERQAGSFVWRNWDKWVERCENIVSYIDQQVSSQDCSSGLAAYYKRLGLTCGTRWTLFRRTVEKYRAWLDQQYGGSKRLRQSLIFAHNDTQYGNILRLEPPGESPLLLPANEHKQLIVIDFEYANANTVGFEFANHFSEWCYNYHDPERSFACNTEHYPTASEQQGFIRAYLKHEPDFPTISGSSRPSLSSVAELGGGPSDGLVADHGLSQSPSSMQPKRLEQSSCDVTPLSLQPSRSQYFERQPRSSQDSKGKDQDERQIESRCDSLMRETRLWRVACSAQWVAWGIMQARVPGFGEPEKAAPKSKNATEDTGEATSSRNGRGSSEGYIDDANKFEVEEEFDYLRYAHERALFFWGDCVGLGLVKEQDLPVDLRKEIKLVDH